MNDVLRRVVVLAIAVGAPTVAAAAVLLGPDDPVVRWGYPPMLCYLLVFAWVLVRRPRSAVRFAQVTSVVFEVAWLAGMAVRLHTAPDAVTGWHSLFPTVLMGFVVFMITVFLFQRPRTALLHATAVIVAVVAVGLGGLLGRPGAEVPVRDLLRYAVFLVVIMLLLHALSRAKARLAGAVAAARHADATALRLRDMAYLDPLTGIANRRRLVEELTFQAEAVGPGHPVAVVYFDLDRFKAVNDEHGHSRGDQVLCHVAQVAEQHVRHGDLVARIGGEEFVIVAPGIEHEAAVQLAERLRRVLPGELRRVTGVAVTASFGVVGLRADEGATAVLHRVDRLMYDAKSGGRDRVVAAPS